MARAGLEVTFVGGRRVTDERAILVVREALLEVNRRLCATIGPRAVGLAGDEIGLRATPVPELGCVGTPLPSAPSAILEALAAGRMPVVAPLAEGPLNVNADDAAAALAVGLGADRILFLTDVPGVLRNEEVLDRIDADEVETGEFEGGILPKLQAAVIAAQQGVQAEIGADAGGRLMLATRSPVMHTYARTDVTFVDGEGSWLTAADGTRYLDFAAGIAVVALGHAHPAPLAAAQAQLERLWHVSNLYWTEPMATLAELLSERFGGGQAFFCNSGAEAIESAIKYARKATGKPGIVALEDSFHGRTLGALSATGQPAKRAAFEPLVPGVTFARLNDTASLEAAVGPDTGLILIEPVQGEGGVNPATPGFLAAAAELAAEHGALLCFDEVQTGVGRTGTFFAFEQLGVRPHLVTLAKGLANGLPIGALLAADDAPTGLEPGDHASTFGGNPVVCAAACAVVETVDDEPAGERPGAERPARRGAPRPRRRPAARPRGRPGRGRPLLRCRPPRHLGRPDDASPFASAHRHAQRRSPRRSRSSRRSWRDPTPPRAPGRDPAPDPRATDLDPGRACRRAPRGRLRRRPDDRLPRHRRARARQGPRRRAARSSTSTQGTADLDRLRELEQAFRRWALSIEASDSLVVVFTPRGFSAALGDAIDESNHPARPRHRGGRQHDPRRPGRRRQRRDPARGAEQTPPRRSGMSRTAVLAYSGGLDTTCIIAWLKEYYGYDEVVAVLCDVGQEFDLEQSQQRGYAAGADDVVLVDRREAFANEQVAKALKTNALYEGKYPLVSALSRPVIAGAVAELARRARRRGRRPRLHRQGQRPAPVRARVPRELPGCAVIAPLRDRVWTRDEEIEYAQSRGIPITVTQSSPFSFDENLFGRVDRGRRPRGPVGGAARGRRTC